jgi:hypothetical protein
MEFGSGLVRYHGRASARIAAADHLLHGGPASPHSRNTSGDRLPIPAARHASLLASGFCALVPVCPSSHRPYVVSATAEGSRQVRDLVLRFPSAYLEWSCCEVAESVPSMLETSPPLGILRPCRQGPCYRRSYRATHYIAFARTSDRMRC